MDAVARVIGPDDVTESISPQAQVLTPMITNTTTGASGLSGGVVRMPAGAVSRCHVHAHTEIIVAVLAGHAATVVWEDGRPRALRHGPGEMCYVPAGLPHCAINLSPDAIVMAMEFRTDPAFNDDVVLLPDLDAEVPELARELRGSSLIALSTVERTAS